MEKAKRSMDNRPIIDGLQIPEKQVLQKERGKVKPNYSSEVDNKGK